MANKKFSFKILRDGIDLLNYSSEKYDSHSYDKKSKKISFKIKGDKLKEIEALRFNEVDLKEGNKSAFTIKVKSYTKVLDNGFTLLGFNCI